MLYKIERNPDWKVFLNMMTHKFLFHAVNKQFNFDLIFRLLDLFFKFDGDFKNP